MTLEQVKCLCERITMKCLGNSSFNLRIERDNKQPTDGRIFLQVSYSSPCIKTGDWKEWRGRKFYLSDHMIEDEIIKTAYLAFKLAVEHEVMEGFTIAGTVLFNPHVDYVQLVHISQREVRRDEQTKNI